MPRNPTWTRDELILALELYLRHRERLPDSDDVEIVELSRTLNSLFGAQAKDARLFRNPNSVYMKRGRLSRVAGRSLSQAVSFAHCRVGTIRARVALDRIPTPHFRSRRKAVSEIPKFCAAALSPNLSHNSRIAASNEPAL
jgi:hypothetical protein